MPASRRSLPPRAERNLLERLVNQEGQKGCVVVRSVVQVYCVEEGEVGLRSGGTLTRAESVLRRVRLRRCHSMAEAREGKVVGRVER